MNGQQDRGRNLDRKGSCVLYASAGVSILFIYGIIYEYSGLESFIHEDSPIIAPVRDAPGLLFFAYLIKWSKYLIE